MVGISGWINSEEILTGLLKSLTGQPENSNKKNRQTTLSAVFFILQEYKPAPVSFILLCNDLKHTSHAMSNRCR
jgi:hypothetical protein